MAVFRPGTDTEVVADGDPQLDIAIEANAQLPVGKHVFRLVVVDDAGNESEPAVVTIIVADQSRPTAVIDVVDASGGTHPEPEFTIALGQRFGLSGRRSSDVGGQVRTWRWTLLRA